MASGASAPVPVYDTGTGLLRATRPIDRLLMVNHRAPSGPGVMANAPTTSGLV
jgi:hypothetical protein